ncbi:MAG: hypothetical protein Q4F24_16585 [Eubacteriales bacterium]|nr:hypothetical protein [Eubacteriales bacterium]
MKRTWKETILRVIILLIGLVIAHFGVTLFLLVNLGTDPFNVLVQGIFRAMNQYLNWSFLTHGRVHIVISCLIIIILLFVDKTYIKIGTLLCMICGGPIIDFFNNILVIFFQQKHALWINLIILAAACAILAFGMTIVIKSDAGTGPNDLVAVVLSDKLQRKFSIVRICVDVTFVILGFLLGGSVGIGTIVCACLVGPVAGFFLPLNEKWISKLLISSTGNS